MSQSSSIIYADYNGSAPLLESIQNYLQKRFLEGKFANPNTGHSFGRINGGLLEDARQKCAEYLDSTPEQVIFNSGSSEGISHVFYSLLSSEHKKNKRKYIFTSAIEHSAVHNAAKFYGQKEYEWNQISVGEDGLIRMDELETKITNLKDQIALVAVMAANNETGAIQPYEKIGRLCQKYEIPFLCDTTQFVGKEPFSFRNSEADYAVVSGHKVGALIGSGCLLAKRPSDLRGMIFGGGQEFSLRGGTQNYIGAETLAMALKVCQEELLGISKVKKARLKFEEDMKVLFPKSIIISEHVARSGTTTLISFPGNPGGLVQELFEAQNILVSTSSACSDKKAESSRVLKAMGIPDEIGSAVIRISLGMKSAPHDYPEIIRRIQKMKKFIV